LKVPREYIEDLKFEVIVFARKERGGQDFTFRCKDYSPVEGGAWSFDGVIIDTSKRDPSGDVTLKRLTYHIPNLFAGRSYRPVKIRLTK